MKKSAEVRPKSSGWWTRIERQIRLISGLLLVAYVVPHLITHSLGIVSLDLMEGVREVIAPVWQIGAFRWILPGVLLTHTVCSLTAIVRRSTLRMPLSELLQIVLGLSVPVLLLGHIVGTRVVTEATGIETPYDFVIAGQLGKSFGVVQQSLLVVIVWGHACIGLHMWQRQYAWWRRWQPVLYALAVLLPTLSLIGYWSAVTTVSAWLRDPEERAVIFADWSRVDASVRDRFDNLELISILIVVGVVVIALAGRQFELRRRRRRQKSFRLLHPVAGEVTVLPGQSLLEALRHAKVAHASVCGGRARCTTCRVEVSAGVGSLSPPDALEAFALQRIGAGEKVRLACQTRPLSDLAITPLVNADAVDARGASRGGVAGSEKTVVAMFVDLRESTRLGEQRLPYDVVFILNRFFSEMSDALDTTGGHYAQFAGDGLLALYGLDEPVDLAIRNALAGAANMMQRIDKLNQELSGELPRALRIGIGIHAGDAIVGDMGPPSTPIHSAIGDTINIAARLEAMTKDLEATVVVSAQTIEMAGLDYGAQQSHDVTVRGREATLTVYALNGIPGW